MRKASPKTLRKIKYKRQFLKELEEFGPQLRKPKSYVDARETKYLEKYEEKDIKAQNAAALTRLKLVKSNSVTS